MRKVLLYVAILFVFLQIINIVSHYIIFDRTNYEYPFGVEVPLRWLVLPWLNFDGKNYLQLELFGYANDPNFAVFYPVYPLLIRSLSLNNVLNPIIVGLLISAISAVFSTIGLYKLTKGLYTKEVAFRTCMLLLAFPSAFYLFAFYSEALFLLLTVLTFYFLSKKRYFLSTVLCAVATATRFFGLALACVLVYEVFIYWRRTRKVLWALLLTPSGFLFYMLYNEAAFGSPFFMIRSQSNEVWGKSINILNPVKIFTGSLSNVLRGPQNTYDNLFVYPIILLESISIIFLVFACYLTYKTLPRRYFVYVLSYSVIISLTGTASNIIRYLLPIFPFYIAISAAASRRYFSIISSVFFVLLLILSSLFFRNYWVE